MYRKCTIQREKGKQWADDMKRFYLRCMYYGWAWKLESFDCDDVKCEHNECRDIGLKNKSDNLMGTQQLVGLLVLLYWTLYYCSAIQRTDHVPPIGRSKRKKGSKAKGKGDLTESEETWSMHWKVVTRVKQLEGKWAIERVEWQKRRW